MKFLFFLSVTETKTQISNQDIQKLYGRNEILASSHEHQGYFHCNLLHRSKELLSPFYVTPFLLAFVIVYLNSCFCDRHIKEAN